MPDDVAVVREPSLADALVPLGALAGLIAGLARIEKTEPIALEENA